MHPHGAVWASGLWRLHSCAHRVPRRFVYLQLPLEPRPSFSCTQVMRSPYRDAGNTYVGDGAMLTSVACQCTPRAARAACRAAYHRVSAHTSTATSHYVDAGLARSVGHGLPRHAPSDTLANIARRPRHPTSRTFTLANMARNARTVILLARAGLLTMVEARMCVHVTRDIPAADLNRKQQ